MSKQQQDEKILEGIGEYKYGFHDRDDNYAFKSERGLNREVVENISRMKSEPQWMMDFRLKALDHFLKRPMPNLGTRSFCVGFAEYFLLRQADGEKREIVGRCPR